MESPKNTGNNKELDFIERLKAEVDANLTNPQFGVEELARNIGMSRSHLHRKLTMATGQSVSQFIREYRLQLGMSMLKGGHLTATEVADRVGFGSATYFNKCFNEFYGFPPGEAKARMVDSNVSSEKIDPEPVAAITKQRKRIQLSVPVLAGLIVVIMGIFYWNSRNRNPPNILNDKSIAILPFKNLSAEKQNEHFSEGVVEAIRTNLSQVNELRVISRTSVEQYRETSKSAREIADELDVATLLEGSVQRNGNHIRIDVRLIDGATEGQLWSSSFDRELEDVFVIQSEIAQHVAGELNAKLSPEEKSILAKTETENAEAYDLYLKGIFEYRTYTNVGLHNSIAALQKAIALDSNYARPYAVLANSYVGLATIFGAELGAIEALEKGAPLIAKALELDPDLDEAHMVRGFYLLYHDWDFAGAEAAYKLSIRNDHPDALALYIDYLNFVSRHDEALEWCERMNIMHPYYPNSRVILSYYYNNRMDDALKFSETRLQIFNNYYTLDSHGFLLLQMKKYDQAIAYFNKAIALENIRYPRMLGWMGAAYAHSDNYEKSREIIEELKKRWSNKEGGSIAFFIAVIYSALDQKAEALEWLKIAFDTHEMEMPWLLTEPQFYNLHMEPAFRDLATRMAFPQTF